MKYSKYRCNTGETEPIYKNIEDFFKEVKEEIGDRKDGPTFFKKLIFAHCSPFEPFPRALDGNTQVLCYKDHPVATVIEIRDDSNWHTFTFFKNLDNLIY